jgi:hypothetical protein
MAQFDLTTHLQFVLHSTFDFLGIFLVTAPPFRYHHLHSQALAQLQHVMLHVVFLSTLNLLLNVLRSIDIIYGAFQGREGLVVPSAHCRWHFNWFIHCPVVLAVSGSYNFTVYLNGSEMIDTGVRPVYLERTILAASDGLTHAHAGPALPETFLTTNMNPILLPGVPQSATIEAFDLIGNRAMFQRKYIPYDVVFHHNMKRVSPKLDGYGNGIGDEAKENVKECLQIRVTLENCTLSCGRDEWISITNDTDLFGLGHVVWKFFDIGSYLIDVKWRGVLGYILTMPSACPVLASML